VRRNLLLRDWLRSVSQKRIEPLDHDPKAMTAMLVCTQARKVRSWRHDRCNAFKNCPAGGVENGLAAMTPSLTGDLEYIGASPLTASSSEVEVAERPGQGE
jgi:hypothetical protein